MLSSFECMKNGIFYRGTIPLSMIIWNDRIIGRAPYMDLVGLRGKIREVIRIESETRDGFPDEPLVVQDRCDEMKPGNPLRESVFR